MNAPSSMCKPILHGAAIPFAIFFAVTAEMAPAGAVMHIARFYDVDVASAALGSSVYAAATAVVAIPLAHTLQAAPLRTAFLMASIAFALMNTLTGLMPSLHGYLVLRTFSGITHGAFFPLALAMAAKTSPCQPERAVARALLGNAFALAIGVPAGEALAGISWRLPFLLASSGILITASLAPSVNMSKSSMSRYCMSGESIIPMVLVGGAFALALTGHFAFYTFLAPRAELVGLAPSVILAIYGGAVIAGTMLSGRFAGQKRLRRAALVIIIEAVVVSSVLFTSTIAVMAVAALGAGLSFGLLPTIVQSEMMARSAGRTTLASGVAVVAFNFAIASGAFFGGRAETRWHEGAFVIAVLTMALSSILFLIVDLKLLSKAQTIRSGSSK